MKSLRSTLRRFDAFAAGVLLGLTAITPVFAATFEPSLPPRDWLLMGSLALLAVALALAHAFAVARRRTRGPDEPDMRWWRNP